MALMTHPREERRLASLRAHDIVGTPRDSRFDRLTFLAAQALAVPIAVIGFVEADRLWFKAMVGLTEATVPRECAPCERTLLHKGVFTVEDARVDSRFANGALVTGPPFMRFYAGTALFAQDGLALGTICVIDRLPRHLTTLQEQTLLSLAREAEQLLHARRPPDRSTPTPGDRVAAQARGDADRAV
jgi:GAF domain-containing protein